MARDAIKDLKEICDDLSQKKSYIGLEEYSRLDILKDAVNTLYGEGYIDDRIKHMLNNSLKKIGKVCGIKSRFP